jgi:hypothetical protein
VRFSPEQLRSVEVFAQKARYILDFAVRVQDENVNLRQIDRYSDERVLEQLTTVKDIVVENMRTWEHSGFSVDQSVFLPAGAIRSVVTTYRQSPGSVTWRLAP